MPANRRRKARPRIGLVGARRPPPPAPLGNKRALGNRGGRGNPSPYHAGIPEACRLIALLGATDKEIAAILGIAVETFDGWKRRHPELLTALRRGKIVADAKVAEALYERAIGYSYEAVKIFIQDGKPLIVPCTKYLPPDTAAAIFWLKNRQPQLWGGRRSDERNSGPPTTFIFQNTAPSAARDMSDPYGERMRGANNATGV